VCLLFSFAAEARRHKKFKGVIIVNQILKLDGHVTRNGVDAPEYSGVKQGDILETPEKSAAVIRIPGLAILRMGSNTKLKLTQFNDRNEARFELLSGELLALFRRVGTHEVKLPKSTIKLHGTTFIVAIKDSKTEELRLDDGKIEVALRNPPAAEKPTPPPTPTPEPTAVPTPVASPLFHASLSAPATPTPAATPKIVASPTPTPSPTAGLPTEVTMTATTDPQFCEILDSGINLKPEHKLDDQQSEIRKVLTSRCRVSGRSATRTTSIGKV
jgi:hypothetical protein